MPSAARPFFVFKAGRIDWELGRRTKIMGVLNVTPDSFSDGGLFRDPAAAEDQAIRMQEEGADIIDIGGESARPGAKPVSAKEEKARILPVLKRLSRSIKVPLSVDTYKAEVAQAALDEGVSLVNDIKGLRGGRRLGRQIARYRAGVVLMHMRGTPRSMQAHPEYSDILEDIKRSLKAAIERADECGIPQERILIDPGFGFGKTLEHNIALLARLDAFREVGCPLLVGVSRKSFVGRIVGTEVSERLFGSLGAAAAAVLKGAHVLRVHDVRAHRHLTAVLDRTLISNERGTRA